MKLYYLLIIINFLPLKLLSQYTENFQPNYRISWSGDFVKDKNFYLLSLIEQLPEVQQEIQDNAYLKNFSAEKKKLLKVINNKCALDINCYADAFILSSSEINNIGDIISDKSQSPGIQKLIHHHLRPSGFYYHYQRQNDREFIRSAWSDNAEGINHIINVYALAGEQQYPKIDSVSYDVNGTYYKRIVDSIVEMMADDTSQYDLFFQPSLYFTLNLMDINDRDEAARFEPMKKLENKPAFDYIKNIQWDNYSYSVILVPGHGPEEPEIGLSPFGKLRNKLAAERYHAGMAPLIIVSGGYVHPFQTNYCEAVEMKKDLMNRHQVPAHAILIDPHARHTTTNFRNAARLIYRYNIPSEKKALCTTTKRQSYYITDMNLDQRCQRELGYIPFEINDRLSIHDVEWLPKKDALHIDPADPLDP